MIEDIISNFEDQEIQEKDYCYRDRFQEKLLRWADMVYEYCLEN